MIFRLGGKRAHNKQYIVHSRRREYKGEMKAQAGRKKQKEGGMASILKGMGEGDEGKSNS